MEKTDFTRQQRYEEALLDTFDMLSPAYDLPMTAAEVRSVLNEMGVEDYSFRTTIPINITGRSKDTNGSLHTPDWQANTGLSASAALDQTP